jgi:zinc transport system substrate-binding protein
VGFGNKIPETPFLRRVSQFIRRLLVLTHGYEAFIDRLVDSAGRNRPKLVNVRVAGNWMVPDVYIRGARQVTDALCAVDPKHSADYYSSLSSLEARTKKLSAEMSKNLKANAVSRVAVLCSDQQKPFVEWMGFKVVGTYARAEEFTAAELHELTTIGRRQNVRLVIDNLQSGPTAGKELSKDIGAAHVTLSNFPGGFAGTDTWSACLRDNVRRVLKGLKR